MESIKARLVETVGGDLVDDLEARSRLLGEEGKKFGKQALKFADAQCLPLGLFFALLLGIAIPVIGSFLDKAVQGSLSVFCVVALFLISGLKLSTAEAKEASKSFVAMGYGLVSIFLVTSMIGTVVTRYIPLEPEEFKLGLSIFFCSPSAINTSVVLTKQVRFGAPFYLLSIYSYPALGRRVATLPWPCCSR